MLAHDEGVCAGGQSAGEGGGGSVSGGSGKRRLTPERRTHSIDSPCLRGRGTCVTSPVRPSGPAVVSECPCGGSYLAGKSSWR